jgi:hypothetical protein
MVNLRGKAAGAGPERNRSGNFKIQTPKFRARLLLKAAFRMLILGEWRKA